jgi:hypothetical protein
MSWAWAPNVDFYEKMVNVYLLSGMEFANDSPYKRVLEVALTTAYQGPKVARIR